MKRSAPIRSKPRPSRGPSPTTLNFQPSGEVVHATTARGLAPPQPKAGELWSIVYLAWVRRRPCEFCGAPAPSEAQHVEPKRMGRATVEDLTCIAVCFRCHRRCEGETVVVSNDRRGPISQDEQWAAVGHTLMAFLHEAHWDELRQVGRDIATWRKEHVRVVPA